MIVNIYGKKQNCRLYVTGDREFQIQPSFKQCCALCFAEVLRQALLTVKTTLFHKMTTIFNIQDLVCFSLPCEYCNNRFKSCNYVKMLIIGDTLYIKFIPISCTES